MNQRPPHEPSRHFPHPQRLWDDPIRHTLALGCPTCLDRELCGGVHTDAGVMDCRDLCSCQDKTKCDMVCRFNPRLFAERMCEVDGLSFDKVGRVPARGIPSLPLIVPLIDHRYRRAFRVKEPVVALSLYDVINMATGEVNVHSREELAERFLVPADAAVILTGVDKDGPIERWWELSNRPAILTALERLNIALVTTPNYSVLLDVPRTDNLHAMKRIFLAWTEMTAMGLRTALHLNARTEQDFRRWADLIIERTEIQIISFEFATGCGRGERIDWHVDQLCKLADSVGRPLTLVIRGGGRKASLLRQHYAYVTLLETEAFARALRRRRAYFTENGRLKWAANPTPKGSPLDELLAHNIAAVRVAHVAGRQTAQRPLRPLTSARGAANRNNQTVKPSFQGGLDLADEARSIARDPQHMVPAAKT